MKGGSLRATTQRGDLLELLGKLKPALGKGYSLPIIAEVLIRAEKGKLTLTATDLNVALVGEVSAEVSVTGAVCVPPKPLETFLKATSAKEVMLTSKVSLKQVSLTVQGDGASVTLDCHPAEDFPPVPVVKETVMPIPGLVKAVKEVEYAMLKETDRPVLHGICFKRANGKLELAAADGYRLAITSLKCKAKLPDQVVVPAEAIRLLPRLAAEVSMAVHEDTRLPVRPEDMPEKRQTVSFEGGGLRLVVQGNTGTYPAYWQLVPKGGKKLTVDVIALRQALKAVTAIKPQSNIVRLETKRTGLVLSARSEDAKSEATVPCTGKVKIAFNVGYLTALLNQLHDQITLKTKGPSSPGVVAQNGTTHVIMPMFVQW